MHKIHILFFTLVLSFLQTSSQPICFERTYDTLNSNFANCVKQTFDNGFITCGAAFAGPTQDALVLKLDSMGDVEWSWTYSTPGTDGANHILQQKDSTFIC
jgi:hypothetical protein